MLITTNYSEQKPPHIDDRVTIISQPEVQDQNDLPYIGRTGIVVNPKNGSDFILYRIKLENLGEITVHYSELYKISL